MEIKPFQEMLFKEESAKEGDSPKTRQVVHLEE